MKNQDLLNLKITKGLLLVVLCFAFIACDQSEYSKLVKTEMSKDIVHDTLFFGMNFGQSKQEFFDKCWKLNAKGLVSHGPSNDFVKHDLPLPEGANLTQSIRMLFYGIFNEERRMTGMNVQYSYNAWSLWNKDLQPEKLLPIVKDTIMKWFPGNDFIKVKIEKDEKDLLVKVDGNRRIIIKPIDDKREVKVRIDDLRYILD
ncbi:MAG: hypothetical protein HKO81_10425 [Flavobacteriaceae bacterium]|nr:hypothetical protein [Flavobacteriaceae bacterium]